MNTTDKTKNRTHWSPQHAKPLGPLGPRQGWTLRWSRTYSKPGERVVHGNSCRFMGLMSWIPGFRRSGSGFRVYMQDKIIAKDTWASNIMPPYHRPCRVMT